MGFGLAYIVWILLAHSLGAESVIRLKSRSIRPAGVSAIPAGGHYVVQFRVNPGPGVRAELASRGIRVLGPVPEAALMVSSDSAPDFTGLDIVWTGRLAASDKLSPELGRSRYGGYLVIFHPDVGRRKAEELVWQRGLTVWDHPDLLPGHLLVAGGYHRIGDLAAADEVAYVMPASPELAGGQHVNGCAGALTEAGAAGEYTKIGGWPKNPGGAVELHYAFASFTTKMEEGAIRNEVARAFEEWARYADFRLTSSNDPAADRTIAILFARGPHGDEYPFEGPGGMLAHTFFPAPPNREPWAGDMHLDTDERWHAGADIDLFTVTLHEAGHALGLGHSSKPGTVMYPYYRLATGLTEDDILGIQDLYGQKGPLAPGGGSSSPPAAALPPPVVPPPNRPASPPGGDRTQPFLQVVSPGFGITATFANAITVRGTASDDVGVRVVTWTTSNGESGTASGTTNWSAVVPLLVGDNVIIIRAYDDAGNGGWRAITVVRR